MLWIEPQYLDPWSCSHAMHIIEGEAREEDGVLYVGDWTLESALDSGGEPDAGQAAWLEAIGNDAEKERARLEGRIPELHRALNID